MTIYTDAKHNEIWESRGRGLTPLSNLQQQNIQIEKIYVQRYSDFTGHAYFISNQSHLYVLDRRLHFGYTGHHAIRSKHGVLKDVFDMKITSRYGVALCGEHRSQIFLFVNNW